MNSTDVLCLIKFGKKKDLKELVGKGIVYMNTWRCFQKIENDGARSDRHEGLIHLGQASMCSNVYITPKGGAPIPIQGLVGQIRVSNNEIDDYNLFCMFAMTEQSFRFLADEKLKKFGDCAAVFVKGDEFLAKLRTALKEKSWTFRDALVEYVDETQYSGKMGPFKKFSRFEWQSEFRVCVHTKHREPIKLKIGDLRDIVVLVPTAGIQSRLTMNTHGSP